MDGPTFWSAVSAIGTCVAAVVAVLTYRARRAPQPNPASSPLPERPSSPPSSDPSGMDRQSPPPASTCPGVILGRSSSDRPVPRVLEVAQEGEDVCFSIHPPGKSGGSRLRVSRERLRATLAAGEPTVASTEAGKVLALRLATEAPGEVGEDQVRVEAGWWVTVPKAALREALQAVGVPVRW